MVNEPTSSGKLTLFKEEFDKFNSIVSSQL